MHPRTCRALPLALLLSLSCGDGAGPAGPDDPPAGATEVVLRTAAAVTQVVGHAGGVLTTSAAGVQFTLDIPAGALFEPTMITLTPLAEVRNPPFSGGVHAGAHFAPEGLELFRAAAFRMEFTTQPNPRSLAGFAYDSAGVRMHAQPVIRLGNAVSLAVTHFSGAGAASASEDDLAAIVSDLASRRWSPAAEYGSRIVEAERAAAVEVCGRTPDIDCLAGGDLAARIAQVRTALLEEWYDQGVKPVLERAVVDDSALARGRRELSSWRAAVELTLGGASEIPEALEERWTQGREVLAAAYLAALLRAKAECRDQRMIQLQAEADLLLIGGTAGFPTSLSELEGRFSCIVFETTGVAEPAEAEALDTLRLRVARAAGAGLAFLPWPVTIRLRNIGVGGCVHFDGQQSFSGSVAPVPSDPSTSALEVPLATGATGCSEILLELSTSTWIPDPQEEYQQPFDKPMVGAIDTLRIAMTPVRVEITPATAVLDAGAQAGFTATVTGTQNTAVTWSATGGTITSNGLYTAGSEPGTYSVVAFSVADPQKSDTARVEILSGSSGSRAWPLRIRNLYASAMASVNGLNLPPVEQQQSIHRWGDSADSTNFTAFDATAIAQLSGSWQEDSTIAGDQTGTAAARAVARQRTLFNLAQDGSIISINVSGSVETEESLSGTAGGGAWGESESGFHFEVRGASVTLSIQGSCASSTDAYLSDVIVYGPDGLREVIGQCARDDNGSRSFARTLTLPPGEYELYVNAKANTVLSSPGRGDSRVDYAILLSFGP